MRYPWIAGSILVASLCLGCSPDESAIKPEPNPERDPSSEDWIVGSRSGKPVHATVFRILPDASVSEPDYAGVLITVNASGVYRISWNTSWDGFESLRGSVFTASNITPPFFPGCADGTCKLQGRDTVRGGLYRGSVEFAADRRPPGSRGGFEVEVGNLDVLLVDIIINGSEDSDRVRFVNTATGQLGPAPTMPFGLSSR